MHRMREYFCLNSFGEGGISLAHVQDDNLNPFVSQHFRIIVLWIGSYLYQSIFDRKSQAAFKLILLTCYIYILSFPVMEFKASYAKVPRRTPVQVLSKPRATQLWQSYYIMCLFIWKSGVNFVYFA